VTQLSLFDDDSFRRLLGRVHLTRDGRIIYARAIPIVVAVGWFLPFIMAAAQGRLFNADPNQAFLNDINLPVQTLAVVILLLAEQFIDEHIRDAGRVFASSGILQDRSAYEEAALVTAKLRKSISVESR
jgi:hypothetical protein